jgi:type IV pilus assembly protein PilE
MKRICGFSLIELLIAVAIVSILAAVALPAYQDYIRRGKLAEAYTNLASQRVKMEQFYQDTRTYNNACQPNTVAPKPADTVNFRYTCAIADQTYTVTATGLATGNLNGFVFTVDQNNNRATTGVPAGWTSSANCWIRHKDGSC